MVGALWVLCLHADGLDMHVDYLTTANFAIIVGHREGG